MNLFAEIEADVRAALATLQEQGKLAEGLDTSRLTVEPPRDASHGDMATNAAMVLAKAAGQNPRDLATLLVAELLTSERIEAAEIAGPGFVNLRLDKTLWHGLVPHILATGLNYGDGAGGAKVNVEYVSANPTGPMHVGHARGAVVGDVLARLLEKTGSDVLREYYINDAGEFVLVFNEAHEYPTDISSDGITAYNKNFYNITVAAATNSYGAGNKYIINGITSPTLNLYEGQTYTFGQSIASNATHPLRLSTTPNGIHAGGVEYTDGVTVLGVPGVEGSYVKFKVPSNAPTLYYYCINHSGMGGQINTLT